MPDAEKVKNYSYVFSILVISMVVRVLIGLWKPSLSFAKSTLIGVTTVMLVAPPVYRTFFKDELIKAGKQISYTVLSIISVGMFLYFVAL
jgi:hypothetical protein